MTQNGWNSEYNSAKGSLLVGNATRPIVVPVGADTFVFTADSTTPTGTKWAAAGAGSTINLSPYIVGPTQSDFTTISAAITQAIADGASTTNQINIYVKPDTYTENLTLADGINIIGFDALGDLILPPTVEMATKLDGTITFGDGQNKICNIQIKQSAPSNPFIFNGTAGALSYHLQNVVCTDIVTTEFVFQQTGITYLSLDNCKIISASKIFTIVTGAQVFLSINNSIVNGDSTASTTAGTGQGNLSVNNSHIALNINATASTTFAVQLQNSTWSTTSGNTLFDLGTNAGSLGAKASSISCNGTIFFNSSSASSTLNIIDTDFNKSFSNSGTNFILQSSFVFGEYFRGLSSATFHGTYTKRNMSTVQTTNATATTIATIPILTSESVQVLSQINGFNSAFTAMAAGTLTFAARNTAGAVTVVGTPISVPFIDAALVGSSFTAVASGTNVLIQVTGIAATTINWSSDYNILYTQSSS